MVKLNFKKNNIPNLLTIFRIILTPIIIILILVNININIYQIYISSIKQTINVNLNFLLAFILFCVVAITDFLDGFLARKWNCVSSFGKFWDPIADKILVNSTLFAFCYYNMIPIWLPIILLCRDIIMDGIRINAIKQNITIPANIWGKLKTFLLMFGIIIVFLFSIQNTNNWYYWIIQNILIILSCILSMVSLIIYFLKYKRILKNNEAEKIYS